MNRGADSSTTRAAAVPEQSTGRATAGATSEARAHPLKAALDQTKDLRGKTWASLDLGQPAPAADEAGPLPSPATPAREATAPSDPAPASSQTPPAAPGGARTVDLRNILSSLCWSEEVQDSVRALRSHLMMRLQKQRGRSVLLTSPGRGEGKSYIALHLALNLAQEAGQPVTLIDADPHAGLTRQLGLEMEPGIAEWLSETGDGLPDRVESGVPGLSILPAGHSRMTGANRRGILRHGDDRMSALVYRLGHRLPKTLSLFDGPPLSEGSGALLLSGLTDGVLLVVQAERTRTKAARRAADALTHLNLLGTVLNQVRA